MKKKSWLYFQVCLAISLILVSCSLPVQQTQTSRFSQTASHHQVNDENIAPRYLSPEAREELIRKKPN